MDHFLYRDGALHAEDVALSEIAAAVGTPFYCYSSATLTRHYNLFTEALQHELRGTEGAKLSAHLLIPGFVFTALTRGERTEKPDAAWTSAQTVDFMLESLERGDFYILCPDNDVPRKLDENRMAWAIGDIIENRPPLSRWHPEYGDLFKEWLKA